MLVSIDHYADWPEANVLRKPNTDKLIEILKTYIVPRGIPKAKRTNPATTFRSNKFKEFCKNRFINQPAPIETIEVTEEKLDSKNQRKATYK